MYVLHLVIKETTLEKQLKEEERILESLSERKGKTSSPVLCFFYHPAEGFDDLSLEQVL